MFHSFFFNKLTQVSSKKLFLPKPCSRFLLFYKLSSGQWPCDRNVFWTLGCFREHFISVLILQRLSHSSSWARIAKIVTWCVRRYRVGMAMHAGCEFRGANHSIDLVHFLVNISKSQKPLIRNCRLNSSKIKKLGKLNKKSWENWNWRLLFDIYYQYPYKLNVGGTALPCTPSGYTPDHTLT